MTALIAVSTAVVLLLLAYLALMVVLSLVRPEPPAPAPSPLHWVILVPALNEAAVIANTLDSLAAISAESLRVVLIDDGSDDATADIGESYAPYRFSVLRRSGAQSRQGKGRALNHALDRVRAEVAADGLDPARVIVGIVDGDGRLAADALDVVGPLFADPGVGAVQVLVRIYNRADGWLPRFQDFEFLTFASITQSAREHLGSVGLGGNGQFTRLSALNDVGAQPWSECLTEDLDLGLRLAMLGWRNRFTASTLVAQQGLADPGRMIRQRTRWMQGHFQCWRHLPALVRSPLPTITVLDLSWYLLAPAVTLLVSLVFGIPAVWWLGEAAVGAIGSGAQGEALWADWSSWDWGPLLAVALATYVLSFGPSLFFCCMYRRQSRELTVLRTLAMSHLLSAYNYLWYVATWKAVVRLSLGRNGWAKTARIDDAAPDHERLEAMV